MSDVSTFEEFFVDPGHTDAELAAGVLAQRLRLTTSRRGDRLYLGTFALTDSVGHVGGQFERNLYGETGPLDPAEATPSDIAIFDHTPMVWALWSDVADEEEQRRRARVVFGLVVSRVAWPCILTHDFEELVATYDPERGVREFPRGTPSDGTGRHLWA